jgi:hypothetical protein
MDASKNSDTLLWLIRHPEPAASARSPDHPPSV